MRPRLKGRVFRGRKKADGKKTRRGPVGILTGGLFTGLIALGLFLGGGAPAGASGHDTCPNAELRERQNAQHLPDCRAYEQVSPVDKDNNHAGYLDFEGTATAPIITTADGTRVAYGSGGAFAGSVGYDLGNTYLGTRSTSGWHTDPLTPPIAPYPQINGSTLAGSTDDLTKTLEVSGEVLAPGAVQGNVNFYVHNRTTTEYDLIDTEEGTFPSNSPTNAISAFGGFSTDGSSVVFGSRHLLDSTPAPPVGAPTNSDKLYAYVDGSLTYVGVRPDNTVTTARPGAGGRPYVARNAISDDGNRIYWSERSSSGINSEPTYLNEEGESTLITRRETDDSATHGIFTRATPDGDHAFVMSENQLTADASPSGTDLYRYDAAFGDLVDITPTATAADVEGVLGISNDGKYVYFQATGDLAPGAVEGDHNLYVWHDGEINLIGLSAVGLDEVLAGDGNYRVSPNGRYLGFLLAGGIDGPDPQSDTGSTEAYLYDNNTGELVCASCATGGSSSGDARLQYTGFYSQRAFGAQRFGSTGNVLDNGSFYFSTPNALVTQDTNGRRDVYRYVDGGASLVSSGRSRQPSFFGTASADGSSVFFVTSEPLVSQDQDEFMDVYAVQLLGGIASQNTVASPKCSGEGCQGEPGAVPEPRSSGSRDVTGSGNAQPAVHQRRCAAHVKRLRRVHVVSKRFRARATQAVRRSNGQMPAQMLRKVKKRAVQLKRQRLMARRSVIECRRGR